MKTPAENEKFIKLQECQARAGYYMSRLKKREIVEIPDSFFIEWDEAVKALAAVRMLN